jgi:transposase
MRKIRDVIRLALGEGLSLREVGRSLDLPFTTVGDHVRRAVAAGLTWPLPAELDDRALEALLFPPVTPSNVARPMPDWAHIHAELRRKGVTLELLWLEYREQHPDGYGYSQFANLYRTFKGKVDVVMRQHHRAGSHRARRRLHAPQRGNRETFEVITARHDSTTARDHCKLGPCTAKEVS